MTDDVGHGACCPSGTPAFRHPPQDFSPRGTAESIDGMDIYVVGPQEGPLSGALVMIPEVFGIDSGRLKLVADTMADNGFFVVLSDLMRGRGISGPFDWSTFGTWVTQFKYEDVKVDLERVIDLAQSRVGPSVKIGALGFCWGSFVSSLASGNGTRFSAAAAAHPSHFNLNGFHGIDDNEVMAAISCPQMFLTASNDPADEKKGGSEEQILSRNPDWGSKCVFHEFPHVSHGWVTRGELSDPAVYEAFIQALEMMVDFLRDNLAH